MGVRTATSIFDNSSDVNFRAWGSTIGPFFTAAGWQQTTDTGQINWSTVTRYLGGGQMYYGYEIFKSTDALSTTFPIIVKIEYGNQSSSSPNTYNCPAFWFTVGTRTDGAGNFIGNTTGRMFYGTNTTSASGVTTSQIASYGSWAGSGANIALLPFAGWNSSWGSATPVHSFIVERSKDANGNDTADYISLVACSYGGWVMWGVYALQPNTTSTGYPIMIQASWNWTAMPVLLPDSGNVTGSGANVYMSPLFPLLGKIGNPMRMVCGAKYGDFGELQVAPMTIYGVTQNYLLTRHWCAGARYVNCNMDGNNYPNGMIGIRWDAGA